MRLAALFAASFVVACSTAPGDEGSVDGVMPDFSLQDVNPASATSGQQVSPRQQLGHISGWYFAHAT